MTAPYFARACGHIPPKLGCEDCHAAAKEADRAVSRSDVERDVASRLYDAITAQLENEESVDGACPPLDYGATRRVVAAAIAAVKPADTHSRVEALEREVAGRKLFTSRMSAQLHHMTRLYRLSTTSYGRLLERNVQLCRLLREAGVEPPEGLEGEPPEDANQEFDGA